MNLILKEITGINMRVIKYNRETVLNENSLSPLKVAFVTKDAVEVIVPPVLDTRGTQTVRPDFYAFAKKHNNLKGAITTKSRRTEFENKIATDNIKSFFIPEQDLVQGEFLAANGTVFEKPVEVLESDGFEELRAKLPEGYAILLNRK